MNIRKLYKEYLAKMTHNARKEKYLKLNTAQKLVLKDFVRFVERKVRNERDADCNIGKVEGDA
jgi:hypothetical protein